MEEPYSKVYSGAEGSSLGMKSPEMPSGSGAEGNGRRTRVPSRKVASPNNIAPLPGRAGRAGTPCHQGTSAYKGVSWSNRSRAWRAQLWHNNKVRLMPSVPT